MKGKNKNNKQNNKVYSYVAVGPYYFSLQHLNQIRQYYSIKFNSNIRVNKVWKYPDQQSRPNIPFDEFFHILEVPNYPNAKEHVDNLVQCSGYEIQENDKSVSSAIILPISNDQSLINDIYEQMRNVLDQVFSTNYTGTLDLSNFSLRFKTRLNFNRNGVLGLVFFLCAKHVYDDRLPPVRIIEFKNNGLHSLEGMFPLKKVFPMLETIIVEGNGLGDNLTSYWIDEIRSTGVIVQLSTGGYNSEITRQIAQKPLESNIELDPPELGGFGSEKPDAVIDPSVAPNQFVINFLRQSAEDVSRIAVFYHQSAVMSMTAETSTALMPYLHLTRSLIHGRDNFVQGPNNIAAFSLAIFNRSVVFAVKKIQSCMISDFCYTVVIGGFFVNNNQVRIGFDRSLFIGQVDDSFFITNDQIHLRPLLQ